MLCYQIAPAQGGTRTRTVAIAGGPATSRWPSQSTLARLQLEILQKTAGGIYPGEAFNRVLSIRI